MKHLNLANKKDHFKPLLSSRQVQSAIMTLKPGESSSDHPEDEHPRSEQWLFVISGFGLAKTAKRSLKLKPQSLLLIEKDEAHQITNTGRIPMITLNLYAPPAYTKAGDVKPSAKK